MRIHRHQVAPKLTRNNLKEHARFQRQLTGPNIKHQRQLDLLSRQTN